MAIDYLTTIYQDFAETWREIELLLVKRPDEVGIRGLVYDGVGLGYYLHPGGRMPPIDVLYRYDVEKVYVESLVVELRLRMAS